MSPNHPTHPHLRFFFALSRAVIFLLTFCCLAIADEKIETTPEAAAEKKKEAYDFENEDAFMDVPDALRSRQFVHRAILSTIIRETSKVQLGSFYFNHIMGFAAVYQPSRKDENNLQYSFAKYVSGVFGVAGGYVTTGGHTFELGIDLSANSLLFLNYKKFTGSQSATFWPYFGAGAGTELSFIRLTDLPPEAKAYLGSTMMAFLTVGTLIPLVDVAIKAEARFCFFGMDRLMLSTGVGMVFFL